MKFDIVFKENTINDKYTIMNKKLNSSPERGSFRKECRLKSLEQEGINPEDDDYFNSLLDFDRQKKEREQNLEWQKNNMEYDLRSTAWVIAKVKESENYAQNLYAALCNNQFIQPENTWDILKEEYWSCSWRYAGGIIADIKEEGDYIDWYCTGIGDKDGDREGFVGEGFVTDEIKADLKKIGWVVIPNKDDNYL